MLLPDNIHPENSIYYNSAIVLESLQNKDNISLLELYREVREIKKMSFPVFIFCLDWLYLINVATLIEGKVKLCS